MLLKLGLSPESMEPCDRNSPDMHPPRRISALVTMSHDDIGGVLEELGRRREEYEVLPQLRFLR